MTAGLWCLSCPVYFNLSPFFSLWPGGNGVKNPFANAGDIRDTGSIPVEMGPSLEMGIATHSSILAWRIPWTEEPGGLQSMGSKRVG